MTNDPTTPKRIVLPLALGLSFAAATMAWSLLAGQITGDHKWRMPGDFWFAARQADYVASGAFAYVYEADHRYLGLPAWPIVLAAPVALCHALGLLIYSPAFPSPKPSSWPLLGAFANGVTALTFVPVRRAMGSGASRRSTVHLVLFGALVFLPAAKFGHFEDVLGIGCVVLAEHARRQGKHDRAALFLGLGVGFKTAMLLAAGAFLTLTPRAQRIRAAAITLALPAALAAIPLAVDWSHASRNLFASETHLKFGHALPFLDRARGAIDAGPYRAAGLVLALAVGWWLARRATTTAAQWLAYALAFLPRVLVEPALHPYYVAPVVTMVLIGSTGTKRPAPAIVATAWTAWVALVDGSNVAWWLVFWVLTAALVAAIVMATTEEEVRSRRYTEGTPAGHPATHAAPRPTYPR